MNELEDLTPDELRGLAEIARMYRLGKKTAVKAIVTVLVGMIFSAIGYGLVHMYRALIAVCVVLTLCLLTGCTALNKTAEGLSENDNSGVGVVNIQRVGIDPTTRAPVLKNINVWGEFHSIKSGDTLIRLNSKSSPSIFNSASIERELTVTIITGDPEKSKEYAKQVADALAKGLPSDGDAQK